VKWLKPVYAGETLSGTVTILTKRVSSKRPEMGIFQCLFELFNEAGEKKTEMTAVVFMRVNAA
jgi:acyl dehydratase